MAYISKVTLKIGSTTTTYDIKAKYDEDNNSIKTTYLKANGNVAITGHLTPNANGSIDIGSSSKKLRNLYTTSAVTETVSVGNSNVTLQYDSGTESLKFVF